MTATLSAALLPLLMMIAGIGDFLTYRIPNWLTALVALSFFPMAFLTGLPIEQIGMHVAAGAALLVAGFGLFAIGWFGGGDAKLLAAAGLWFGWPSSLHFIMFTALAGGVLAAAVGLYSAFSIDQEMRGHSFVTRWMKAKPNVPYGVALAAGAILAFPDTWWMQAVA